MTLVVSEIGQNCIDPTKEADAKKKKVSPLAIDTPQLDLTSFIQLLSLACTSHFHGRGVKVSSFSC